MPDRSSRYRVVRLAVHVPPTNGDRANWSLIAVGVKRGVPSAQILLDGTVPLQGPAPSTEEILDALDSIVRSVRLV